MPIQTEVDRQEASPSPAEPHCEVCYSRAIRKKFEKQGYTYFACPHCRHLQLFPIPAEEDLIAEYAHGFGASRESLKEEKILKFAEEATGEFPLKIFRRLRLPLESHILDIGCSFGYDLFAFRSILGCENIYGVEISQEARRIATKVLDIPVFPNLGDLALQEITFDFVYLQHNLEHQRHPLDLLQGIHTLLKPGGFLLIGVPNWRSINGFWGKRWEWMTPPIHIHFFSKRSVTLLLEATDLKISWFKSQRGHGMPLLKHALFHTPWLGQQARKLLGDPYNPESSKYPHTRKYFESAVNKISELTLPFSSLIKSRFHLGEELWALAKK